MATLAGRQIDESCPWSGQCWVNYGCSGQCPDTTRDLLVRTAAMEHECELLTNGEHTDPDLQAVCREQHADAQSARWTAHGGDR